MVWIIFIITVLIIGGLVTIEILLLNQPTIKKASFNAKEQIMTVTYSNGKTYTYIKDIAGDWNNYPMMDFVGRSVSNELQDIYYYIVKWGNDYPTAHLNKEKK